MRKLFFILTISQIVVLSCNSSKSKLTEQECDSLQTILEEVFYSDQELRLKSSEYIQKYGQNSEEVTNLWDSINENDSINLIIVKNIIDTYGWLSSDEVSNYGNLALFLVIQHADLKTQENYLPILKDAVERDLVDAGNLAYLEDRIAIGNGKKQIYGTQLELDSVTGKYKILPIEDSINLDKRRKEVGLPSLKKYLSDIEEYRKEPIQKVDTKTEKNRRKVKI